MDTEKDTKLWKLVATYDQESDDCDEIDTGQEIEILAEDGGAGKYYVIKTRRWAFDKISDLVDLLKDFAAKAGMGD